MGYGVRDHTGGNATPACMGQAHSAVDRVVEEYWQAVGEAQEQCDIDLVGNEGIGCRDYLSPVVAINRGNVCTMDLVRTDDTGSCKSQRTEETPVVFLDGSLIVADCTAEVQGSKRRLACAAKTGDQRVAEAGRGLGVSPIRYG